MWSTFPSSPLQENRSPQTVRTRGIEYSFGVTSAQASALSARLVWTNSSSAVSQGSNILIEILERKYSFRNYQRVVDLLKRQPNLAMLLLEAEPKIRRFFQNGSLVLVPIIDPESNDEQLNLYITTSLSASEALQKLLDFDSYWWLMAMNRTKTNLNITLEYR